MSTAEHKKNAPERLKIGVISISTTRTLGDDKSGKWIKKTAIKEGHDVVVHEVIKDDREKIRDAVVKSIKEYNLNVLLLTGGTGISNKDVTIEAVRILFNKELTAFGSIFAQLSYEEIDSAAILSRATAGISGSTVIFCMPGSIKACKLACKALIFPELGHIVKHIIDN